MQLLLPFTKMQGLGNDFVVLNNLAQNLDLTPQQIRLLADRHFGIGCDQILLVEPAPNAAVDFGYRIFNGDGSPSGQCGNGARCLAKFIQLHHLSSKTFLKIATSSTTMELELLADGNVRVNMGTPNFSPQALPMLLPQQSAYQLPILDQLITFAALSMGNPHVVIQVPDVVHMQIDNIGKALQAHPAFPESVNVGFMQILDRAHIQLRVYERGCGETLACGSGACAAMVAARQNNLVDPIATVSLPGGSLILEWQGEDQPVWMTGPAVATFEGEFYL